jgi:hypothetical protein
VSSEPSPRWCRMRRAVPSAIALRSVINTRLTPLTLSQVDSVKGWWITLAPFPPCLLWSLVVRSRWLRREAQQAKDAKKD